MDTMFKKMKTFLKVLMYVFYVILKLIFMKCTRQTYPKCWYDYLEQDPIQMPILYLYSKSDICVDTDHIQEMAEIRRKMGFQVQMKDFEDTSHVAHFVKYPEAYMMLCLDFLKNLK